MCIKSSCNFHSIIGKCIKVNVVSVHFSVTTLFTYKTKFEVTDPPTRASHHVMAMGGTVPYFITILILHVHFCRSKCLESLQIAAIIKDGTFLCTLKLISALHLK